MRQLFLGIWTNDQIGGMESYLTTSVDATPTDAELETFVAATQGEQGQWQAPDLEGGLVHAALTVVRLTGGGLHDAASAVRQQAALIWHDEDLQQVMNYVREHDGDPRKLEVRRYDRVMAGEQQAEGEEFQEDEDDGEFQAVENR